MIACTNAQHLVEVKLIKKKKNSRTKFGTKRAIGSLVYLEIVYNDSLYLCLTSSRGKILKKNFWAREGQIRPETRFFAIFSSLGH